MSLLLSSTTKFCTSLYLKLSALLGYVKNYLVNKARGYVLVRLAEMQQRSALIEGLQLEDMSFDSIDLLFKISVYNSFHFSLPVSQASFKLKISGRFDQCHIFNKNSCMPSSEQIFFIFWGHALIRDSNVV